MQHSMTQPKQMALHGIALAPLIVVTVTAILTLLGPATALDYLDVSAVITDASQLSFTLMLACTPLTILFSWRWTQPLKRPLGLYAFLYGSLHYLLFSSAFNFQLGETVAQSVGNAMLLAGTLAIFLMIPLALTSSTFAMKLLGRKWKWLHKLVYLIAILIAAHLIFLGEGLFLSLLYAGFLLIRVPKIRKAIVAYRQRGRANATLYQGVD